MPSWRLATAVVGLLVLLAGAALGLGAASFLGGDERRSAATLNTTTDALAPATTAPSTTTTVPETTTSPPGEGSAADEPLPEATGGSREPGAGTSGTTTDGAAPATPGGSDTSPSTTGPATTTPGSSGETLTWPPGRSGHTVVLASVQDRGAAESAASRARDAGISAGVLDSDDFGSLRPGYWVAFAGRFTSLQEAQAAAARHQSQGFPDAYPRRVER
jgi:hypothetical protein